MSTQQQLPNSIALVAPFNMPTFPTLPGSPNPFYIPNNPAPTPTPTPTPTPSCNCEQSTSTCNCPTPTPTPILSPASTPTDNKKYLYIAGGLIIAFCIFSKK